MNELRFRRNVFIVVAVYAISFVGLIIIKAYNISVGSVEYDTIRDSIPLIVATPAAWLAYCFQRRQSYLKDVRALYTQMVNATQDAIQYTHLKNPNQAEFGKVQKTLSATIEEIRSVFINIGENDRKRGLYPFEGLKEISRILNRIGFGDGISLDSRKSARDDILAEWQKLRRHYLGECDRGAPVNPHSPFLK